MMMEETTTRHPATAATMLVADDILPQKKYRHIIITSISTVQAVFCY
jgi:hypothetical protein